MPQKTSAPNSKMFSQLKGSGPNVRRATGASSKSGSSSYCKTPSIQLPGEFQCKHLQKNWQLIIHSINEYYIFSNKQNVITVVQLILDIPEGHKPRGSPVAPLLSCQSVMPSACTRDAPIPLFYKPIRVRVFFICVLADTEYRYFLDLVSMKVQLIWRQILFYPLQIMSSLWYKINRRLSQAKNKQSFLVLTHKKSLQT